MAEKKTVFITGAAGYIGSRTALRLQSDGAVRVVAADIRPRPAAFGDEGIIYIQKDIRSSGFAELFREYSVDAVIHLASIVTPSKGMSREFIHSVDVDGTRNILDAAAASGVRQIIVTSSGAAYGYYADNPQWIDEEDSLRGNPEFAYSDHKRQVEEMLVRYKNEYPQMRQLILRLCTVLGRSTDNQITNLFHQRFVTGIAGSEIPFVFVWDEDVVSCIIRGIYEDLDGIYNVAGDGIVTLREIAKRIRKPYIAIPPSLLRGLLSVLHRLRIIQYGPEQIGFLRYRPVLSNARLKNDFGYVPVLSSRDVLELYLTEKKI